MRLTINGEIKLIESTQTQLSLSDLIVKLDYHPKLVVVELNGTIITPENWKTNKIKDGDSLEIVTIVGGGS